MRKVLIAYGLILFSYIANAQSVYMHEAQEDSDGSPMSGLLGMALLFGIIYMVSKFIDMNKETKQVIEKKNADMKIATTVAKSMMDKFPQISKYQYKDSWKKGYIAATYDIQHGSIKKIYGKTLDDLKAEYKSLTEAGHLIQANAVMEKIGYYEHLLHNNELLVSEGRKPVDFLR